MSSCWHDQCGTASTVKYTVYSEALLVHELQGSEARSGPIVHLRLEWRPEDSGGPTRDLLPLILLLTVNESSQSTEEVCC
jgi:hypothetical protein